MVRARRCACVRHQALAWALSLVALFGEIGMVVALFNGMAHHESTIVVATYYIAMTLFASLQGLCVFDLMQQLTGLGAVGFVIGVLLCVTSVVWMAGMRAQSSGGTNVDRSAFLDGVHPDLVTSCDGGTAPRPPVAPGVVVNGGVAECGPVSSVRQAPDQAATAPSSNGPPPLEHRHTT